jgi:predicted DNA binding CopG/RHH family protein
MVSRKSNRGNYDIEDLGDIELPPDVDAKVKDLTQAADDELEATRVNFRWQREPLRLVKSVAAAMGIPYQTYIKQVLYRQALDDLAKIQVAHVAPSREHAATSGS